MFSQFTGIRLYDRYFSPRARYRGKRKTFVQSDVIPLVSEACMPVYIENDTPPLSYSADISDVFLVSFVSMMEHGCQFRDRRVYRKGVAELGAALSSFHFPDSMPYNVYAVVYLFSRYFTLSLTGHRCHHRIFHDVGNRPTFPSFGSLR